jgi:hypothetical protein
MSGMRCICGDEVACFHQECLALLTDEERRRLNRGRPQPIQEDHRT